MASGMGYIFISYSHKDKDYVHRLQDALQGEGFEVWIDDRIDYGEEWPMVIQDRLDACDAFILVATEDSYKSKWVQKEVTRAQRIDKPFFPLLLSGNPWLFIESTQYADVRDKSLPPEKFYKRLAGVTPRNKPIPPSSLEESKAEKPIVKPARLSPLPVGEGRVRAKPASKFAFRCLGIGGLVVSALILGAYGLAHLPATPKPTPTAQATSTYQLPTATLEPPTETSTTTLVPTPTLGIGSSITGQDGMKLLYVPAGNFLMGSTDSDPNAQANEKPQHTVYLDAFWIDQTDVTNKMYSQCVGDKGACQPPWDSSSYTHPSYYGNSQFDNYPVIYVNWDMANTYCRWAGRQLPTEAQWEKAARGTDGRTYPWGNNAPENTLLNYNGAAGDTTAVGSYPKGASPYGALDMAGNAWQWVANWYATYPGNTVSDPAYGTTYRVLRGGSWGINFDVRSAGRDGYVPSSEDYFIGFRCVRSQ
jgi:formylglycine-generating enzyme required for sulfatase activity